MTTNLQPVFAALGYETGAQQRALVKLLHLAEAWGKVPDAPHILSDRQADAILEHVQFNNATAAAEWLHEATQASMLRKPNGTERCHCEEPKQFQEHHDDAIGLLKTLGMISEAKPTRNYYDHVLVLGAMEQAVDTRLDTLKQLFQEGVRYGKIHLLGSERPCMPEREPSGKPTEMDMMEARLEAKSADWPEQLQNTRTFTIDCHNKSDGSRANTQDTIRAWYHKGQKPGRVLVISNQPYVRYQDAAVKSVLPRTFHVETVGAPTSEQEQKVTLGLDALARQIDVGFPKLLQTLKGQKISLSSSLAMLDPASIQVDAATYQFRSGGDTKGVTAAHKLNAAHWDPVLHGDPLLVHERLDGSYYVADGHHRHELAMRTNAAGTGPGMVAAHVLREADGYTAQDVKIIAAYKNIAHGQTDVIDTARVFKEVNSSNVHKELLPTLQMDKGNLRLAYSLSGLSETSLARVQRGEVKAEMAAEVVRRIKDTAKQDTVMRIIADKLRATATPPDNAYDTDVHVALHTPENGYAPANTIPDNWQQIQRGTLELTGGGKLHYEHITAKPAIPAIPASDIPAFLARLQTERTNGQMGRV